MQVRLFGNFELRDGSGRHLRLPLSQPKRLGLLAYLVAARPRGFHRRDTLLDLFWSEQSQEQARRALNQAVYSLRRALGADVLESRGVNELRVAPERLWCDVSAFEDALARGALEEALAHYRADLLEGFYVSDVPEFERWLELERAALRERARQAASTLAENAETAEDVEAATRWARKALQLAPGDERALQRLILLMDRAGDRAGALREYATFARQLATDLEVEPSPETMELVEQVRSRSELVKAVPLLPAAAVVAPSTEGVARAPEPLPAPPRAPPVPIPRLRTGARHLPILFFVVVAFAAWFVNRATPARPPPAGSASGMVAVFPFSFQGNREQAFISEGLVSLLSANIDGSSGMQSVDARALAVELDRTADGPLTQGLAAEIAQRLDAELFVLGDVVQAGSRVRITASLHDGGEREVAPEHAAVEGEAERLFELADALTAKLLASRAGEGANHLFRSAMLTTQSIPALQAYLEGDASYRAGRYDAAIEALRHAVHADSSFALAYLRLSTAATWTGEHALSLWAAQQAERHATRLAAPDRRQVEAWHFSLTGRADQAEPLYREIIAADPRNLEASYHLADLHFHWGPTLGRPAAESRIEWERVLALDPLHAGALLHLARIAAGEGRQVQFDSLAERLSGLRPDGDRSLELRLLRAFSFADTAMRPSAARDFSSRRDPLRGSLARSVLVARSDLAAVSERLLAPLYRQWYRTTEDVVLYVQAEIARGRPRAAEAVLDSALTLAAPRMSEYFGMLATLDVVPRSPAREERAKHLLTMPLVPAATHPLTSVWRGYLLGLLALRQGEDSVATRHISLLERYPAERSADRITAARFARVLRAERLRQRSEPAQALALLGEPQLPAPPQLPLLYHYPLAHERWLRAELLLELGRLREARRWYATFPDPRAYDLMYLAPAHLRRAEINARLGQSEESAEHYRRALELWRDADAELEPRVREARAALERLRR